MKKPEMIIFDYGNTLICEPAFDSYRGNEELFKYVTKNKNNLTPRQVSDFAQAIFNKTQIVRDAGFEIHGWQNDKFLYEYLGIELSVTPAEAEKVFRDSAAPGAAAPNIRAALDYISANGIRSGVISNISFSGAALAERINRLLPDNKFEFIIASSEYMFRKPSPYLFGLALRKAGLDASDVWFCGDNVRADVEGAASAGIFPVWYDDLTVENPWRGESAGFSPAFEYLHIHDWNELIGALENLK